MKTKYKIADLEKVEELVKIIDGTLQEVELVDLYNKIVKIKGWGDKYILHYMHDFDKVMAQYTPTEIVKLAKNVNTFDYYFTFSCGYYVSFNNAFNEINTSFMAHCIAEEYESLDVGEIRKVLNF